MCAWGAPHGDHQSSNTRVLQLKLDAAGLATRHQAQLAGDGSKRIPAGCGDGLKQHAAGGVVAPDVPVDTSLHHFVYQGDFEGFRAFLAQLSLQEHFPSLLGAMQVSEYNKRRGSQ